MKILGIEFAPLRVPLQRRLQTYALLYSWTELLTGPLGLLVLAYLILFTSHYLLPLIYLIWLIYDRETPEKGSHNCNGCTRARMQRIMRVALCRRTINALESQATNLVLVCRLLPAEVD